MTAQLMDGKVVAAEHIDAIKAEIAIRINQGLRVPCLAVILVGHDPASAVYVRNKKLACNRANMRSLSYEYDDTLTEEDLLKQIDALNANPDVDGILVQLPLPAYRHAIGHRAHCCGQRC